MEMQNSVQIFEASLHTYGTGLEITGKFHMCKLWQDSIILLLQVSFLHFIFEALPFRVLFLFFLFHLFFFSFYFRFLIENSI